MTRRFTTQTMLSLMLIFALSWTQTSRADIPSSLKPGDPSAFWCTDRKGAVAVSDAFDQNKDAHKQIKEGDGGFSTSTLVISLVLALAGGFAIGAASR